jgi:uncharacterized RDD family membrane protein YckC
VKCPKCDYLGFETGDRCKNCGYDFSLLSAADAEPADYDIHPDPVDDVPVHDISRDVDSPVDDRVDDALRISLTPDTRYEPDCGLELGPDFAQAMMTPAPSPVVPFIASAPTSTEDSGLPLFRPTAEDADEEPLIKLPAAPRPPLAVRRTPDTPRLRTVPRFTSRRSPAPVLQFAEEAEGPAPVEEPPPQPAAVERVPSSIITGQSSRPGSRVVAMLIDYLILFGIDAAVVYFTVRMAGLAPNEWRLLPIAPMLTFLGLLKVAYFYAFTAVGGQTIGKMAVGTCVVTESGGPVDAARAMRRTSAGALSFLLLGLGFIPALFGDHRALHDRLAGTRVVRLRSV